jgi:hypothetical protein
MTQHAQNHAAKLQPTRSFQRVLRSLCLTAAFGGVIAVAQTANAGQACTSKPAVCDMQKAKQAQRPQQTSTPAAVKKVVRIKHCTSKPAVCALQRSTQPQLVVATEVVREAPAVKHCTSKPAVCDLQRSKEAAKSQQ